MIQHPRALLGSALLLLLSAPARSQPLIPIFFDEELLIEGDPLFIPVGMQRVYQETPCPGADIRPHPEEAGGLLVEYCHAGWSRPKKVQYKIQATSEALTSTAEDDPNPSQGLTPWPRALAFLTATFGLPDEPPTTATPSAWTARTLVPRGPWLRVGVGPTVWLRQRPAATAHVGAGVTWAWVNRPGQRAPSPRLRSNLDLGLALRVDAAHGTPYSALAKLSRIGLGAGIYGGIGLRSRVPLRLILDSELSVGLQRLWVDEDELAQNLPSEAKLRAIPEWTVLTIGPSWEPRGAGGLSVELLLRWRPDLDNPFLSVPDNSSFRPDWYAFNAALSLRWSPRRASELTPVTLDALPDDDPDDPLLVLE
jgi:hypothetical protein